ncbi:hypothetical protein [Nocardiopsis sp. NRRL B-16309]|uniref:hypothetical protein n=1 Tax=Nocardiopsis sp. NRRL B-16309 TaxID=1519494 RepID=UPI00350F6B4C
MEGADPARTALIATWHDTGETRSGDVNHLGKKYIDGSADPCAIAEDQTEGMPAALAEMVRGAVAEYEARGPLKRYARRMQTSWSAFSRASSTRHRGTGRHSGGSTTRGHGLKRRVVRHWRMRCWPGNQWTGCGARWGEVVRRRV